MNKKEMNEIEKRLKNLEIKTDVYNISDDLSKIKIKMNKLESMINIPEKKVTASDVLVAIHSAVVAATDLGIDTQSVALNEIDIHSIVSFYKRLQYVVDARLFNIFVDKLIEIILGALIAKSQMWSPVDVEGESASPNAIIGPVPIEAFHVGVGKSWDDIPKIVEGRNSWVHSGTVYMNGENDNPIKIQENLAMIIFGVGMQKNSNINAVQIITDDRLRTPVRLDSFDNISAINYKVFQRAFLLKKDSTLQMNFFASDKKIEEENYPFLLGVAFVKEHCDRLLDPDVFNEEFYKTIKITL